MSSEIKEGGPGGSSCEGKRGVTRGKRENGVSSVAIGMLRGVEIAKGAIPLNRDLDGLSHEKGAGEAQGVNEGILV